MAVDEVLLERAAHQGLCSWRFYRWDRPTLSLGYFQAIADRACHPPSLACPVVRRPSGGGAIVHDVELTYAVALPPAMGWATRHQQLYRIIHQALIQVLADWGIQASLCGTAQEGTTQETVQRRVPFLCFQRRTPGDVVVGGWKIAGSAQRRLAGAVLQHGSVLLGRSAAAPELPGLDQWAGRSLDPDTLAEAWLAVLPRALKLRFDPSPLSGGDVSLVRRQAEQKYGSPSWTARR